MTALRSPRLWLALYAAVALFTFGYAASKPTDWQCNERAELCLNEAAPRGFAAALLWPLYWSWELQQ